GLSGNISITYTVGTAPCDDALTLNVNVITAANASWTVPAPVCDADPLIDLNALITGTPGGTWSGTGVSGTMFDPAVGTQSITYAVGTAPCSDISTQSITVTPAGDATWTNPG